MIPVTDEIYTLNIPKCCQLKTYEEHRDTLAFCWGLINNIQHGINPAQGCEKCQFYKSQ